MTGPSGDGPWSRRTVLQGSGAALAAAVLVGCGAKPLRLKVRNGAKVSPADVGALNGLLEVEHYAVAAYTACIPLLNWRQAKPARQFLGQELAHTVQLTDLIKHAGGKPVKPKARYDFGRPQSVPAVLSLLRGSEEAQLEAYLSTIPQLTGGRLRSTAASIFANDAQHLAVLRSQLGEAAVPTAFAVG